MRIFNVRFLVFLGLAGCAVDEPTSSLESSLTIERAPNAKGWADSAARVGAIDRGNPFFTVRSNGRSCATCHDSTAGWTITPELAQSLNGVGPLFKPFDASNNPNADHSTPQLRQVRYRLVTTRGLLRTTVAAPEPGEFVVKAVTDPYQFSVKWAFTRFRRPNSIANELVTQTLSWNGNDTPARALLEGISGMAAEFHLESPITADEQVAMADLMESLVHAQGEDSVAGPLDQDGARGGVAALAAITFTPGQNDPAASGFDPKVFDLYDAWANRSGSPREDARAAIARGQTIFNTRKIAISGVAGLNDVLGKPVVTGACSTCHSVKNIGSHPVFRPMNIGTAATSVNLASELPQITVRNTTTNQTLTLTDLGYGGDTGKWVDLGKFSVPKLRGLASRAPYFHAGSAPTLEAVVGFYNNRFGIGLTAAEQHDLAAFLGAL